MSDSKNPPATIYDVASLAGLSIATVSRVLNAPDKVSPATREKVVRAIDELGFVPKAEARARALQATRRIGVITPFFTAPSFVQRLRGIAAALQDTLYELVIYTVDTQRKLENYLNTLPLTRNLDGLLFISLHLENAHTQKLLDWGIPTVLIEFPEQDFCTVEINDRAGGRMAAQYLLEQGHKRIAFLGDTNLPEYAIHPVSLRLNGFRSALQDAGISLPTHYVRLSPYSHEQARLAAKELLGQAKPPTAIFSATDLQAIGVIRAARDMGVGVPQDLAVLGFDDLDIAEYVGLTTIRQPLDESGRVAIELLLSRLEDPQRPIQHVQLHLSLVKRDTA